MELEVGEFLQLMPVVSSYSTGSRGMREDSRSNTSQLSRGPRDNSIDLDSRGRR